MSSYTFTVTQVTQGFTATVATAAELTLVDSPDLVTVSETTNIVTATSTVQTIVITGVGGAGQSFNQSLNTTDNVTFNSVTTHEIYGMSPVSFPTGIDVYNIGQNFVGDIDQAGIFMTFTNQLSLLYALLPLNFGVITAPSPYSVDFGTI